MRIRSAHRTVAAVMAAFAFQSIANAATTESALQSRGAALLQKNCSRCHAINKTDTSRHERAPPFRDVVMRYPAENLAESLAEGIVSGHPDMPVLTFEADDIDAMIAYLNTLNDAAP